MEQQQENSNTISLMDIQFIIEYIDLTVSRGALKGDEILEVGLRRKKFQDFIKAAQEHQQNQQNQQNQITEEKETN